MALTDSLIAYWKLDEASGTRNDSHGSNHLTDNNTVGSGTGKINNGADFEVDDSDYLSIASNSDLQITTDQDFTITGWFKWESQGSTVNLVSKHSDIGESSGSSAEYVIWASFARPRLTVGNNSSFATVSDSTVYSDGNWHFLVAWHSSADDKIYLQVDNGTPSESAWSGGTLNSNNAFNLSSRFGGAANFDGIIDEVGFWKRTLTTQERTDLYNSGNGLSYDSFAGAPAPLTFRVNV